jgi:N-ethylmaleimide reductase
LALDHLAALQLAFVHVVEGTTGGPRDNAAFDWAALQQHYKRAHPAGGWIVNNGYTRAMALTAVASGQADAVAFGRAYISNPDLAERLRVDAPLAELDRATLYGGSAAGYTDYPALAA